MSLKMLRIEPIKQKDALLIAAPLRTMDLLAGIFTVAIPIPVFAIRRPSVTSR
ncbi:hypothetical protein D3C77_807000 [compost metagenome]